jgi:FkbM family methyltransferase
MIERLEKISEMYTLVRGRHGLFLANENDTYIGRALIEYGEYGEKEWSLLSQICQTGEIVIEVGANIGTHTVSMARAVGPEGQVIAIEPQPVIHQNLCANIALNSLTNVMTHQCACGAHKTRMMIPRVIYSQPGNFGGVALQESGEGLAIDVHRLDDLFDLPELKLIKVDVEGMEQAVLTGADRILRVLRPILYVENDRIQNSQSLIELIWRFGYKAWWHIPRLFNEDNFFSKKENKYGNVASFNMLCIPETASSNITGLQEVTDSKWHPLQRDG